MLEGFTEDWLTSNKYSEDERKAFPIMIKGLAQKIGKENAVKNSEMRAGLLKHHGLKIKDARIRKMINLIRNKAILPGLVANSKGYYITKDPREVKRWMDSIDGRISAMMGLYEKARDYYNTLTNKAA